MLIPKITVLGLYDVRLKHGNVPITQKRLVHSYEIELPTLNGGSSYINKNEYPIEVNRFICAKPGQTRCTKPPFCCYYIHLIPDNGEICHALSKLPDTIVVKDRAKYSEIFSEIISEYNKKAHNVSLQLVGKLLILIDLLQSDAAASDETASCERANTDAIDAAIDYINNNFTQKLTLQSLAQNVYLSPIYFRNLFFSKIGVSPYEYILDKRIELAKHLLATTDMPLAEISESCGFSGQAYFGSVFKNITGHTPRGFRININNLYP